MDFKKDEPVKLDVPPPVIAVPMQGEVLTVGGKTVGVICGFGWITNDNKTPTMRPVVLCVVKGGAVIALPAEMANVVEETLTTNDGPKIVPPV